MTEHQSAVPHRFAQTRSEIVATSRFYNNPRVTTEALIQALLTHTQPAIAGRHVLVPQDTTELNFSRHAGRLKHADEDLGPITKRREVGFFLHPSLAIDATTGFALGYGDLEIWNRRWDQPDKHERDYQNQPIEEKESYRWIETCTRTKAVFAAAQRVTFIQDREGDIYDSFVRTPDARTDLLVRARTDRRIVAAEDVGAQGAVSEAPTRLLYAYLAGLRCQGMCTLEVKATPKRRARQARLEVRFARVHLLKPRRASADMADSVALWAVELCESAETVPEGDEPIVWRLLTTHVVETLSDALRMAKWYSWRWWIEQLFRLLKRKGLRVESSQLETGAGLKKLTVLSLSVALGVLQLVSERDGGYGAPASILFTAEEEALLRVLQGRLEGKTKQQQCSHGQGTLAWAAWVIGRLGGWKGYARESPPGPITMRRGLDRFLSQYEGWILARHAQAEGYA